MSNLLVVAELSSPLAGDAPQLDALMECDFAARAGKAHCVHRGSDCPAVGSISMPLCLGEIGGHKIYRSSSPILSDTRHERHEFFARRFGVEFSSLLHEKEQTQIAVGNSDYKSYRLPLQVRSVDRVAWFCVSDGAEMRRWCKRIKSIGKKRSIGYGKVSRWIVTTIEHDYSWIAWSGTGMVLMRPMPLNKQTKTYQGALQSFAACQPPYWHPQRYMEIVEPC